MTETTPSPLDNVITIDDARSRAGEMAEASRDRLLCVPCSADQ
jgi:hypothetical protein